MDEILGQFCSILVKYQTRCAARAWLKREHLENDVLHCGFRLLRKNMTHVSEGMAYMSYNRSKDIFVLLLLAQVDFGRACWGRNSEPKQHARNHVAQNEERRHKGVLDHFCPNT